MICRSRERRQGRRFRTPPPATLQRQAAVRAPASQHCVDLPRHKRGDPCGCAEVVPSALRLIPATGPPLLWLIHLRPGARLVRQPRRPGGHPRHPSSLKAERMLVIKVQIVDCRESNSTVDLQRAFGVNADPPSAVMRNRCAFATCAWWAASDAPSATGTKQMIRSWYSQARIRWRAQS